MPLPGGASDKIGNRYENKWVVYQFVRILDGELTEIELEPIGPGGEKIEFTIRYPDGREEGHQVKRQRAGKGVWSISDLNRENVLEGIRIQTLQAGRKFVFVTSDGVKGLRELAERARDADNLEVFQKHFLSQELSSNFSEYINYLKIQKQDAFDSLRHSEFRSLDEQTLTEMVNGLLSKLLSGTPQTAYAVLAAYAQEQIHKCIAATTLWNKLAEVNIRPNNFASDRSLPVKLRQNLDDYLSSQLFTIAGQEIERAETPTVINAFLHDEKPFQFVFLTGKAGTGKTGVSAQVVKQFDSQGWPVLVFRMDRLDPTQQVEEVGRQILAVDKSPVALLAGMANGRDCLLAIEQLDAVSIISGRHPEFFNCVAKMVREADVHSNMRVLLVCRSFDLENDQRFRQLKESLKERMNHIPVGPFEPAQVDTLISQMGIAPSTLSVRQRELLQLPLHLSLFAESAGIGGQRSLSFVTGKDLFDEFWRHASSTVKPYLSDPNAFASIFDALCQEMNRCSRLSVPANIIRQWESDVEKLISANLLLRQGGRIAFFHEGFFDYVFARFFMESERCLPDYLREGEQSLFLRAQVRQILMFLRDEDFTAYLRDIEALICLPDIRFHIKKLALSIVGQVGNPTEQEWKLLERCLNTDEAGLSQAARAAFWASAEWFRFLVEKGILIEWLKSEEQTLSGFAFNYVWGIAREAPEIAAQLMKNIAGIDEQTDKKIISVIVGSAHRALHPEMETLFCYIADNTNRGSFFRAECYQKFINDMAGRDANAGCRVLGRYLTQLIDLSEEDHPFIKDRLKLGIPDHDITEIGKKAPVLFVEQVFVPVLAHMERFSIRKGNPPYPERIRYNAFRERDHFGVDNLFLSLIQALLKTSILSSKVYSMAVDRLMISETRWAHCVLLRILNVERPDEKAMSYISEHWKRFGIWYDRFSLWDARCLLQAFGDGMSEGIFNDIESIILNHYETRDPWGDKKENAKWHRKMLGSRQLTLLSALPEHRLSANGKKRLAELQRKARSVGWKIERPIGSKGGGVESPLPSDVASKMSDVQWLSAIRRYAKDEDREWLEDRIIGGARELSSMLEKCTEQEPVRFAELMLQLPEDSNRHYFDSIIMGLRKSSVPIELLQSVVAKAKRCCSDEGGHWIVDVIASHSDKTHLPADLLDVVCFFAVGFSDPTEELWRVDAGRGTPYYGGDPHSHGINTVRGAAAGAIAHMIASDRYYWNAFLPILERMVNDSSLAVRSCVADACTQGLRYDRPKAVSLFLILCQTEDKLLCVRTIDRFLYYTCASEFQDVRPIIERMMKSDESAAREAGACHACIAGLQLEEARSLLKETVTGDKALRKGAAQVFEANLNSSVYQDVCIKNLIPLFNDTEKEVRAEAGSWCRRDNVGKTWERIMPVVEAYVESQAFFDDPENFFRTLEEVTDVPPKLLFRAVQQFVTTAGDKARDISSRFSLAGEDVSRLILRAYHQSENNPQLRAQCLDAIDQLLTIEVYGVLEAIESIDR